MKNLLEKSSWAGLWTALITPLREDGSLDSASLEVLMEKQISEGIDGLVVAGSTGEGSLLNLKTYQDLLQKSKDICRDRVPLVAGIGIGGTESSLSNLRLAKSIGYKGVLASPPAYVKAPSRGLKKHFLALAREELAICLYDVPGRAGSFIEENLLDELLGDPDYGKYFVALKDASCNFTRLKNWVAKHKNKMTFLSGDDETFPEFLLLGGQGVISVATHFLIPEFRKVLSERSESAFAQFRELSVPFIQDLFVESNPVPVKTLLFEEKSIQQLNFCSPLCSMDEGLLKKLQLKWKALRET